MSKNHANGSNRKVTTCATQQIDMLLKGSFLFAALLLILQKEDVAADAQIVSEESQVMLQKHLKDLLQKNLQDFGVKRETQDLKKRMKRDKPGIYFQTRRKQEADLPICQNMKGILGGQNAFNYVALILAILTLVVNVNNNINNNNNNLNQFSGNVVGNNNANANTNNNNGNIVNVMPPGKKRKRRSIKAANWCSGANENSVMNNASIATLSIVQGIVKSEMQSDETCKINTLCTTMSSIDGMGRIGKIIAKFAKLYLRDLVPGVSRAMSSPTCETESNKCEEQKKHSNLRCALCGYKVVDGGKSTFLNELISPFARSISFMDFGQNVTVQEFVNPQNFHFHSLQVDEANVKGIEKDEFTGGDTWFPGFSWKVAYCPICNQPLGWIWKSDKTHFNGLRLDKIADWSNYIFGPLIQIPGMILG